MPLIDTSAWQWSGWKIASYLGLRMEEREQFQAETLLMIILSEVWILSVSICCGSNLFHAWTRIIVPALSRQFNFRFVRRRWPKGQNFYTFKAWLSIYGHRSLKAKIITMKMIWSALIWSRHWHTLKSSSHTEMLNPPYFHRGVFALQHWHCSYKQIYFVVTFHVLIQKTP